MVHLGVLLGRPAGMENGNGAINPFDDEVEPQLGAFCPSPVRVIATAKLCIESANPNSNQRMAFFMVSQVVFPRCYCRHVET